MSILIKGIDLPKKGMLQLEIYPDGTVYEDIGAEWQYYPKDTAKQLAPGCDECKYDHTPMDSPPCSECEYRYNSRYEPKEDEDVDK